MEFLLTLRFRLDAIDFVDAREQADDLLEAIGPMTPDVKIKLQKVMHGQAPKPVTYAPDFEWLKKD